MRKLPTVIGLLLVLTLGLAVVVQRPQPARAADGDNLVLQWDEVTLQAIRDTRPFPTAAARALAMMHTAIYDAWAAFDPVAVDTRQRLRVTPTLRQPTAERTLANKEKAISFAAYAALVDLFPSQQEAFDQQMTTLGYATDGTDTSTPVTVGATAAQAVLNYATPTAPTRPATTSTPACRPATSRSTPPTPSSTPTIGSRCGCPTGPCSASPPRTGAT